MKTRFFIAAMLLMAFGTARAQDNPTVNKIIVRTTGDVTIRQGSPFKVLYQEGNGGPNYEVKDGVVTLTGTADFDVTLSELESLTLVSIGDVTSSGKLKGGNLRIDLLGTGDIKCDLDYENVYVSSKGTGDVKLSGDCNALFVDVLGTGNVDAEKMNSVLGIANVDSFGEVDLGTLGFYLYYAAADIIRQNYQNGSDQVVVFHNRSLFDHITGGCQQGKRIDFVKNGEKWVIDGVCEAAVDDKAVNAILQNAAPFFAEQTQTTWAIREDGSDQIAYDWASLSELMRELGENLEMLSDSVDWEQFERDMEKWGADMEAWGRKMEKWGEQVERKYGKDYEYHYDYHYNSPEPKTDEPKKDEPKDEHPKKKSLLYDANWNGFEAGLNMLFNPHISNVTTVNGVGEMDLGIRPFRSWYFGFNIADVGIAFNRKHTVGLFTGVGIGWNNFSWKNPVVTVEDPETGIISNVPLYPDTQFKKSKLGLLYLQVPVMVEIRPTRKLYIDMGVTGGLRIAAWSKLKYMDNTKVTTYLNGNFINNFKLDASLRIGGNNLGFFANYALIPIYRGNAVEHTRPLSFGFSLNF